MSRFLDNFKVLPTGSTSLSQSIALFFACLVGYRLLLSALRSVNSQTRKPPGPPSLPIVGNIWRFNPKSAWFKLHKLIQKGEYGVYQHAMPQVAIANPESNKGSLIYYHGLGNDILILNDMETIRDLFEKRSNIYSDRPIFTVLGKMMKLSQSMPLLPYGPEWRACRKLAHVALSSTAVVKYHQKQEGLAALLLQDILNKPEDFFSHVRLSAGRTILVVTYGLSVASADNNYITSAEETMELIGKAMVPGAFLADLMPFLRYIPFLPFHKEAERGRDTIETFVSRPLAHVKTEMASGSAPNSLTRVLLEQEHEDIQVHEHRVKWTSGSLYGAGAETMYATILVFILAMATYPDVQQKARAEVEALVRKTRLVKVTDSSHLPYMAAVIKETMRWHPALPLGLARCTAADDVYNGYFIPRGTVVLPNVWAIAFAPNSKYDPQHFIPERFIDESQNIIDPLSYAFGFAKRACPGKALAENSVFVTLANLLIVFDILPPAGGIVHPKFGDNLISYPEDFKCRFIPRSGMEQLVEAAVAETAL